MKNVVSGPKRIVSKQELVARLLKKATLDFKCCGGGGRCRGKIK